MHREAYLPTELVATGVAVHVITAATLLDGGLALRALLCVGC